ncbi:hypothetical protein [Longitalea arenae]|uniref:hypothetical protein n=1 Tax=Longitalea arenae TaxID=2812558 RepID=UPI0019672653|nr:hypothetical protein [Longitalea arenae]
MTRTEFEQLSKHEQISVISKYGVFVADKIESGNRLYLYAINSFYVELLHELSNLNNKGLEILRAVDDAQAFATAKNLDLAGTY